MRVYLIPSLSSPRARQVHRRGKLQIISALREAERNRDCSCPSQLYGTGQGLGCNTHFKLGKGETPCSPATGYAGSATWAWYGTAGCLKHAAATLPFPANPHPTTSAWSKGSRRPTKRPNSRAQSRGCDPDPEPQPQSQEPPDE